MNNNNFKIGNSDISTNSKTYFIADIAANHDGDLEKAKEIVQPDLTIAIMSGNYVQRGEVAIIDKFKRSELAIKYGVDLVIELPFVYVSQSADYFSLLWGDLAGSGRRFFGDSIFFNCLHIAQR